MLILISRDCLPDEITFLSSPGPFRVVALAQPLLLLIVIYGLGALSWESWIVITADEARHKLSISYHVRDTVK